MIAAGLRGDGPAVVGLRGGVAVDRRLDCVAGLAERGLGFFQFDGGSAGAVGREQTDGIDRQNGLIVVDEDSHAG